MYQVYNGIFLFNRIDDVELIQTCQKTPRKKLRTSTLIYNHFQPNEADYHIGSEFDPDIRFYCEQNIFSGFRCKYYSEDSYHENLISFRSDYKLSFSLCHVNIRSIKANGGGGGGGGAGGVVGGWGGWCGGGCGGVWGGGRCWWGGSGGGGGGVGLGGRLVSLWGMVLIVNYAMIWQYLMTIMNLCLLKLTYQYLDQEWIYSLLLFIDHPTLISNFYWCYEGCFRQSI